jgi:hypothetical protein
VTYVQPDWYRYSLPLSGSAGSTVDTSPNWPSGMVEARSAETLGYVAAM